MNLNRSTRVRLGLLCLVAGLLVGLLTACQPTTATHDPLRATITPYCRQSRGIDVRVENVGNGTPPVAVAFGGPSPDRRDYETPTRELADDYTWSFPGSRPERVTIVLGTVGWITEDIDWTRCKVPGR